jgi:hypothetical protein
MSTSRKNSVALDLGNLIRTVRSGESMTPVEGTGESVESSLVQRPKDEPTGEELEPKQLPVTVSAEPAGESDTSDDRRGVTSRAKPSSRRSAPKASRTSQVDEPLKKPLGKRSHPDYQLTGLYLRRSTALALKRALLASDQDMSEVVEQLLKDWLQHAGGKGNATSSSASRSGH